MAGRVVYFMLAEPDPSGTPARYKPQIVALAEGLRALGIGCVGNIDYWANPATGAWLIRESRLTPEQHVERSAREGKALCAFVVSLDCMFSPRLKPLASRRLRAMRELRVPTFIFDWIASRFFAFGRGFLKSADRYCFYSWCDKYRACREYAVPWPIGFTSRVLAACAPLPPFASRARAVLWAHRVDHQIRAAVWNGFYLDALRDRLEVKVFHDGFQPQVTAGWTDLDRHWAAATGKRHNPDFYAALGSVQLVDACGGFLDGKQVRQWDSYKLWEGWLAGCCVIALDFAHYGFRTGAEREPQAGVHYIGLRLDDRAQLQAVADGLADGSIDVARIAAAGRAWCLQHFTPRKCAARFLAAADEVRGTSHDG